VSEAAKVSRLCLSAQRTRATKYETISMLTSATTIFATVKYRNSS
jgi:hypothetical protein